MLVAQSCPTLCDPMDCSPPGSSVYRILQARILEWTVGGRNPKTELKKHVKKKKKHKKQFWLFYHYFIRSCSNHSQQGLEGQIHPMACFSKSGLIGTQHVHSFILFLWLLLCYFCVTDVTYVAFMTALNHHDYDHLACLFIGKIFTSFILIIHKEIRFMTMRPKILG